MNCPTRVQLQARLRQAAAPLLNPPSPNTGSMTPRDVDLAAALERVRADNPDLDQAMHRLRHHVLGCSACQVVFFNRLKDALQTQDCGPFAASAGWSPSEVRP